MLCFEVSVNGKRICTAGVGEFGVLSAIVSWSSLDPERLPPRYRHPDPDQLTGGRLDLHVGGLLSDHSEGNHHVIWDCPQIQVGDEITVRVVEESKPDEPTSHNITTKADELKEKREYFEHLKRELAIEDETPSDS